MRYIVLCYIDNEQVREIECEDSEEALECAGIWGASRDDAWATIAEEEE